MAKLACVLALLLIAEGASSSPFSSRSLTRASTLAAEGSKNRGFHTYQYQPRTKGFSLKKYSALAGGGLKHL